MTEYERLKSQKDGILAKEALAAARWSPGNWRREPPDRPGWWWWWEPDWPGDETVCVEVRALESGRLIGAYHPRWINGCPVEDIGGWWAGPLEPPPPPVNPETVPALAQSGGEKTKPKESNL